jgi:uncharacterized protein GlcG (DUF336 family)
MAKKNVVKTIADASSCAAKLAEGKACTMAEMKATIRILNSALKTARSTAKAAKREARTATENFRGLLSRVGL